MTEEWLQRAEEAHYEAIVVTLDSQWPPKRQVTSATIIAGPAA